MRVTRRGLLSLAGGAALAAGSSVAIGSRSTDSDAVPFFGEHQAGITTPAQDRLHFVAFDGITKDRARLAELLEEWTAAAARMSLA